MSIQTAKGVAILGPVKASEADILTVPAQDFVAKLQRAFNPRRKELLARRKQREAQIDAG